MYPQLVLPGPSGLRIPARVHRAVGQPRQFLATNYSTRGFRDLTCLPPPAEQEEVKAYGKKRPRKRVVSDNSNQRDSAT
ncbi:MAG: hypothetical protein Q9212_002665 [Teloschistes hypoglaucus]